MRCGRPQASARQACRRQAPRRSLPIRRGRPRLQLCRRKISRRSGPKKELPPHLKRQEVYYATKEPAGTIVVDTANTHLYLVLGGNRAIRYGVRVGRDGFTWTGVQKVTRKAEWPDWHPPTEMIERQPYLPRFMAGGDGNPLGARAMYLGNTVYRIHGTNQPSTIGQFVSSGCVGMLNEDVTDLFDRVKVGTRVVVLPGNKSSAPAVASAQDPTKPRPSRRPAELSADQLCAAAGRSARAGPAAGLPWRCALGRNDRAAVAAAGDDPLRRRPFEMQSPGSARRFFYAVDQLLILRSLRSKRLEGCGPCRGLMVRDARRSRSSPCGFEVCAQNISRSPAPACRRASRECPRPCRRSICDRLPR